MLGGKGHPLPDTWKLQKLSELAEFLSGGTPSRKVPEYFQGTIPWITGNDVVGFKTGGGRECITEEAIKSSATHLVPKGAVLFVTRTGVGKVSIADADICISQDLTGVVLKNGVDAQYIARYLLSISDRLKNQQRGTTILGITREVVEGIDIPLPPLPVQKQIAAILDKADAARQKRREANYLTEQFLQSAFLEMFGDAVTNTKRWETALMGSLLTFVTSGSRGWAKYYADAGDKFLRIQNVGKGALILDDIAFVNAPKGAEAKRTQVRQGDVLLSITADLGRTCVIPPNFGSAYINQHLSILRTKGVNPIYLSAYISSPGGASQIGRLDRQGVKSGLNFDDIRSLQILVPPREMQEQYASLCERVDVLKAKQRDSEQELDNLFGSLMQRAFRGELVG
jgi:type I restriction enzyme S subunit